MVEKKKKMKCMVLYQYPTCHMHFVHSKRCVCVLISVISFGILYIFKRKNVLKMFFFIYSIAKSACSQTNKIF